MICKLFALCAYLLFLISFAVFAMFLLNLGPLGIDSARYFETGNISARVALDAALVLLFGLHHSVAARPWFKSWLTRLLPEPYERPTYVLVSSLLLLGICILWQPLPYPIWNLGSPVVSAAFYAVFGLGVTIAIWSTFLIDHAALTGLTQSGWLGRADYGREFRKPGLYRIVRHPMQLGIMILLWATPVMSVGHLLLSLGMTIYIFIGLYFEEKGLMQVFGSVYADYRRQVGKILPKF